MFTLACLKCLLKVMRSEKERKPLKSWHMQSIACSEIAARLNPVQLAAEVIDWESGDLLNDSNLGLQSICPIAEHHLNFRI